MSLGKTLVLYWQFLRTSRVSLKYLLGGTIASLLGALVVIWLPRVSGGIIDHGILPGDKLALLRYGAVLLSLFFLTIVLDYVRAIIVQKESERFIIRIKTRILTDLLHDTVPSSAKDTGYLLERIDNDAEKLRGLLPTVIIGTLIAVVQGIIVFCLLFSIHWAIALGCLPFTLLAALLGKSSNRSVSRYSHLVQEAYAEKSSTIHDILQGRLLIHMAGKQREEVRNYDRSLQKCLEVAIRSMMFRTNVNSLGKCIFSLPVHLVLIGGGFMVVSHSVTLGALIAIQLYYQQLASTIGEILNADFTIVAALASLRRIEALIGGFQGKPLRAGSVLPRASDGESEERINTGATVEFRNVGFGYENSARLFAGLSFCMPPGTKTAIVGASGAGKSTLIRLLLKEVTPQAGSILVDGVSLEKMNKAEFYRKIAYVPQDIHLFNRPLRSNLLYRSRSDWSDEQLMFMLGRLGYKNGGREILNCLPRDMSRHGYMLSTGELQRFCLLREVLANPAIIIWDEAGASLDSISEATVFDALEEICPGRTMLFVSHRLSTIQKADQIVVITEESCAVGCSHGDLMRRSPQYRKLIHDQVIVESELSDELT